MAFGCSSSCFNNWDFSNSVLIIQEKGSLLPGKLSGSDNTERDGSYYNTLVKTLYREAGPLLTGQPELSRELDSDMAQIDSICVDIRKDLKDNVANQEVIEALIQNYRIKLQILEDMLVMLKQNENKQEKPGSHEL